MPSPIKYRLHPLAAVQIFQKRWIILLAPFVRAIFVCRLDALWLALQQNAVLLCALLGYTYAAWRNTLWWYDAAPTPTLHLQRGLLLRQHLRIVPCQITLLALAQNLPLQSVRARRLLLYYRAATDDTRQPQPISLTLSAADAERLLSLLLHSPHPTAPLPRQSLHRRSLFAFLWQAGLGLSITLLACLLSWQQYRTLSLALSVAALFYAFQFSMGILGFCAEGIWQQTGYTTLRVQQGSTLWRFYLLDPLPPIYYRQNPFSRRANRVTMRIYPIKGKSLQIRSVLLKSFTPFIGKD